jgi:hypothetical protein
VPARVRVLEIGANFDNRFPLLRVQFQFQREEFIIEGKTVFP